MTTSGLIIGCGYLGKRVATHWKSQGHDVYALTRSDENAEEFSRQGWQPIIGDITSPETLTKFPKVDTVLLAVGYDRHAGYDIDTVFVDGIKNVVSTLPQEVSKLIYISSTGVYAQTDGEWVDEESECKPTRPGGIACCRAEEFLRQSQFADRLVVLRLAGLYGPDRIPRLENIKNGDPISSPKNGYINLIHVDDAVRVVDAVSVNCVAPNTIVVSDDEPVTRSDYFGFVASCMGAPPIQFTEPDTKSHAASRALANKRIRNDKMKRELNFELSFPSYREGVRAILEST